MNRYLPHEPRVFRPHSSINFNGPMATYKRPTKLYRLWRGCAHVAVLLLSIGAAVALIQLIQFKSNEQRPACPSYLPRCGQ